jgi:hypothetical protein
MRLSFTFGFGDAKLTLLLPMRMDLESPDS